MSDGEKYPPPSGLPPNYDPQPQSSGGQRHQQEQQQQQQHHVSWRGKFSELRSNNPFRSAHLSPAQGPRPSDTTEPMPPQYEPPSAPPPLDWQDEKKHPTAEKQQQQQQQQQPADEAEPPPYEPWFSVPDPSTLPPPPGFFEEFSPTANASWDDAAKGHNWCDRNPIWAPRRHSPEVLSRISRGDVRLTAPPGARNVRLQYAIKGRTHVRSDPKSTDTILLSDIPLYSAVAAAAAAATASNSRPVTHLLYFEVAVLSTGGADAGIALGFVAPPYPSWRLPGWHRASLAVHGDDGRRYLDNPYGGREFTGPFRRGDTVGIGMTISSDGRVKVLFARNGVREGGWDVHEERDRASDDVGRVEGLEGRHDLLAAAGCFGGVEFEVRFRKEDWMFKPDS